MIFRLLFFSLLYLIPIGVVGYAAYRLLRKPFQNWRYREMGRKNALGIDSCQLCDGVYGQIDPTQDLYFGGVWMHKRCEEETYNQIEKKERTR